MTSVIKTEQEFSDEWKEFDKQVINKFNYTDEQYKQFYQKYLEKLEKEEDERLTAEYEATKDHRNSVIDDLDYLMFHCKNKKQVKRIFDEDYAGEFYYDIDKDDYLKVSEEEEEEEEEEEDEEDSSSSDEDFPINIPVVGLGWCRYKTMKDVKRETTYCKNTLYKIKGDKTAYDMEGKYCETEDETEDEEEEENCN